MLTVLTEKSHFETITIAFTFLVTFLNEATLGIPVKMNIHSGNKRTLVSLMHFLSCFLPHVFILRQYNRQG